MNVTTVAGQRLTLADDPFNSGAEGRLYTVKGKPAYVAKVFKSKDLARAREAKLKAMCRLPGMCRLPPNLAWPINLLYDDSGVFVGYLMKRVEKFITFNKLYAGSDAQGTIEQRLAACVSLANTLGRMHMCGVAMGDPGPKNIPVLADCTVQLIDTDSFAIVMPDGASFPCTGCTPNFVAPELLRAAKGVSYAQTGIPFDAKTDCYALAVLIYEALFAGEHPSSYTLELNAPDSADMPSLATCEENGWVAAFVPRRHLCYPVHEPLMDEFPPYLRDAFRRTFVDGYANPAKRTTAFEWQKLLTRYFEELVPCSEDERHAHWRGATRCPYCAAEQRRIDLMNRRRAQAGLPLLALPTRKHGGLWRGRSHAALGRAGSTGASAGGAARSAAHAAGGKAGARVPHGVASSSRRAGANQAPAVKPGGHGAGGAQSHAAAGTGGHAVSRAGMSAGQVASAVSTPLAGRVPPLRVVNNTLPSWCQDFQTHINNACNHIPHGAVRWVCVAASYLTLSFVLGASVFQNFVYLTVGMCTEVELFVIGLAGFIAGWKKAKDAAYATKPVAHRLAVTVAVTLVAMLVCTLVAGVLCLLIGDRGAFGGIFKSTYDYQTATSAA